MARAYHQGRYIPKNPGKYEGDPTNVIFRSAWEKKLMIFLDSHPSIIRWNSEETIVPYFWEGDGKMHRYFVDFRIKVMKPDGSLQTILIEVKPKAQTIAPKKTKGKREKTFINEVLTFTKNQAKWKAATEYCLDRGWVFLILTEDQLYKKTAW